MSDVGREDVLAAHARWLELVVEDARKLAQAVIDGTADPDDAEDYLESTRGFRIGEEWLPAARIPSPP